MTTLFTAYLLIACIAALVIIGLILRRRGVAAWSLVVSALALTTLSLGMVAAGTMSETDDDRRQGTIESRRSIVFPASAPAVTSAEPPDVTEPREDAPALIPTPTADVSAQGEGGGNPAPAGVDLLDHLIQMQIRTIVERTDRPLIENRVDRDWIWGPQAITPPITEPYLSLPNVVRTVQYFDKGRLEVAEDSDGNWPVTAGLLVVEMMSGRVQLGLEDFEDREPADTPILTSVPGGPAYLDLLAAAEEPPLEDGNLITIRLEPGGEITDAPILGTRGIRVVRPEGGSSHSIAAPFWAFMTASGEIYEDGEYMHDDLFVDPYFATGRPVAEPFWIRKAGSSSPGDVLVQCFERRCLSYEPSGGASWQVSSNNVGRHYFAWRYGVSGGPTG